MPKLSKDERYNINDRLARTQAIIGSLQDNQWISQYCGLCNWASNGRTFIEAVAANETHEQAEHPESLAILEANRLSISEISASFHDHDCDERLCTCRCGCQDGPFCIRVFGPLCSSCMTREGRGHDECGVKDATP